MDDLKFGPKLQHLSSVFLRNSAEKVMLSPASVLLGPTVGY